MSTTKKNIRIAERNKLRNSKVTADMKTVIKKAEAAVASKSDKAKEMVKSAIIKIDRAMSNKIIHKNEAARRKSRLMKKLNLSLKK